MIVFKKMAVCGLMLIAACLYGQGKLVFSGTITDMDNGESISSASVTLQSMTIKQSYRTSSNAYGFFNVTAEAGTYELITAARGYKTLVDTIVLQSTMSTNIELSKIYNTINEVVVHGYAKRLASTEMSAHQVVVADVKRLPVVLGEPDILKTLQLLPGVTSVGEVSIGFNVRGGNADQNLILLDEAPLFNPSHVFGMFSAFNSNAISTFKFYKGGIPARFGGRLSSVLDVRQFEGNAKAYQADGAIGLLSANLSVQGPIYKKKGTDKANNSFFVAGRRSYFDLFLGLSSDSSVRNTSLYFYDINIKTNWRPNKNNHLFLSLYSGQDVFGFGGVFQYGWGNITSTLRWNHIYTNKMFSNISLVYSNYGYSINLLAPEQAFKWNGSINNLFLKGDWEYKYNQHNTFLAGFMFSYIKTDPGILRSYGTQSTNQSLTINSECGIEGATYVEWVKELGSRLTLHGGLRLNWFGRLGPDEIRLYANDNPVIYIAEIKKYEKATYTGTQKLSAGIYFSDWSVDPRLNASYVLSPSLSIKASFNTLHQYIQLITNNSSTIPTDIYRLAGKYVKPLASSQFSLGVFSNVAIAKHKVEFSVEGFYKTFRNMIDYIDGANLLFNSNVETELLPAAGYAYGVEFFAEKKEGKFTGWLSYTFSSSIAQPIAPSAGGAGINNGKEYPTNFDLPHSLSVVANYAITSRIHAALTFVLRSGKPATFPSSQYVYNGRTIPFYAGRNEYRFPMYHRLDFSITFEGKQRKHFKSDWVISIYNLYNQHNAQSYIFSTTSKETNNTMVNTNKAEQLSIYGIVPSISWQFTIK